jgi:5-methyltetrahydropteroyltriglutamate--homocysteine methyltransferase
LIEEVALTGDGDPLTDSIYEEAVRDTVARFESTGSPVITDGEQRKYPSFWTYSVQGLPNTAPDGFKIPFAAGHTRRMQTPAMALTAFARETDAARALNAGYDLHFSKPIDPTELFFVSANLGLRPRALEEI